MRGSDGKGLILCIDDEVDLLRDLAEELREAGYGVIEASTGAEALDQLEQVQPDLILCDISMPGMDGHELLQAVKAAGGSNSAAPFVFLTALAEREQIIEGKRLGADDYLVKPIDYDLMLATVETRLRQIRLWPRQTAIPLPWAASDRPEALAVLDLLAVGVILTDAARRVHFVNAAARGILQDTGALITEGALSAADDSENRKLGSWLQQIAQEGSDSGASPLALPCPDGARSLSLLGVAFQANGHAARIAIFLGDRQKPPLPRAETLSALYGLTPTEARIALLLASGDKPAAIATALGVSATTVAFHLRNIFEKTGADRQATLVGILFACPAISEASSLPVAEVNRTDRCGTE